eukprot:3123232-Rhodomonas_salina.2
MMRTGLHPCEFYRIVASTGRVSLSPVPVRLWRRKSRLDSSKAPDAALKKGGGGGCSATENPWMEAKRVQMRLPAPPSRELTLEGITKLDSCLQAANTAGRVDFDKEKLELRITATQGPLKVRLTGSTGTWQFVVGKADLVGVETGIYYPGTATRVAISTLADLRVGTPGIYIAGASSDQPEAVALDACGTRVGTSCWAYPC